MGPLDTAILWCVVCVLNGNIIPLRIPRLNVIRRDDMNFLLLIGMLCFNVWIIELYTLMHYADVFVCTISIFCSVSSR